MANARYWEAQIQHASTETLVSWHECETTAVRELQAGARPHLRPEERANDIAGHQARVDSIETQITRRMCVA